MEKDEPAAPLVNFIDNPHAPEVFSGGATGFFFNNGNVHIAFESLRVDHSTNPGPVNRVVIARLVMPIAGAQGLAVGLFEFLKARGLAPEFSPQPHEKLQ
jgi:hypothetical protein